MDDQNRDDIRRAGVFGGVLGAGGLAFYLIPVSTGPLGLLAVTAISAAGGIMGRYGAGEHANHPAQALVMGAMEGIGVGAVFSSFVSFPFEPHPPHVERCSKCGGTIINGVHQGVCYPYS